MREIFGTAEFHKYDFSVLMQFVTAMTLKYDELRHLFIKYTAHKVQIKNYYLEFLLSPPA